MHPVKALSECIISLFIIELSKTNFHLVQDKYLNFLVAMSLHPVHALAVIIDCGVGAWLGHDGFQVEKQTKFDGLQ